MKKKISYIIGLLLVVTIAFSCFQKVFSFKYGDGIYEWTAYYDLPEDSLDLLAIGSSHAFENINPNVLWEEHGIASFDLCGSISPMWSSYYFLKEALKTQKPKLVVLEAYCLVKTAEYMDDSRIIKNLYGMKWNKNKFDALRTGTPKERWLEFGLSYIQYHNRYKDLTEEDFVRFKDDAPFYQNWKGFGNNFAVTPYEKPVYSFDEKTADIPEKQEMFYRKIIELCQEQDIPLMICAAPYPDYSEDDMRIFNRAAEIAAAYGVPFTDYNRFTEEIGLDWTTDFADSDHLNHLGNVKFTRYLGDMIEKNYTFESHKGDARYVSWDRALHYYQNSMENQKYAETENAEDYAKLLSNLPERCIMFISLKGNWDASRIPGSVKKALEEYAIFIDDQVPGTTHLWSHMESGDGELPVEKEEYYQVKIGKKELIADSTGIYWNLQNLQTTKHGLNLVIFDQENQQVVDSVSFDGDTIIR
ncbi:MAG: SGNH/GDSL hydrolase family protein [Blautia sp.]|nr:SGNH/GDSL hydrolase family protein [Blautia sp.]